MANGCCTNALCADRETQFRLARLREELLTNFNTLLIERIRFLEHTINQWTSSPISHALPPGTTTTTTTTTTTATTATTTSETPPVLASTTTKDRLSAPSSSTSLLRRSSSTTAYFLQSPMDMRLPETSKANSARSCPSSVDLSSSGDRRARFFSSKKLSRTQNRTFSDGSSNYLSIPMDSKWSTLSNDLGASNSAHNEKGRLESRRFACDVDDNEVRALKAMMYMEQARKQNARPLTRLRQALGISNNSSPVHFTVNNVKKNSNS
jgi:hypothetical protein